MHVSNFYYGHEPVLKSFCRYTGRGHVYGLIQHGIDDGSIFPKVQFWRWFPVFPWSEVLRSAYRERGWTDIRPIGSPILYLESVHGARNRRPNLESCLLTAALAPHHIVPGAARQHLSTFLKRLTDSVDPSATTVFLHINEFEDRHCQDLVERFGFQVSSFWQSRADLFAPKFLDSVVNNLSAFDTAIASNAGTAFWYAAFLGLNVSILSTEEAVDEERARAVNLRQEFREYLFRSSRSYDKNAIAIECDRELGIEFRRSPEELCELLGLDKSVRPNAARLINRTNARRLRLDLFASKS